MNKKIAAEIADDGLRKILSGDREEVKEAAMQLLKKPERYSVTRNETEYRVKLYASYENKKDKIIRVAASVDDMSFWSAIFRQRRTTVVYGNSGLSEDRYKEIAEEVADESLRKILSGDKEEVKEAAMQLLKKPEHYSVTRNETEYRVKLYAFYGNKKEKIIRAYSSVTLGSWSAVVRASSIDEDSGEQLDDYN